MPKKAVLTGDMLEDARMDFDRRNRPLITFQWNDEGAKIFREFTGAHIGDRLAAIIDGKVITAPVIQSQDRPATVEITGDFTREEASNTAIQLRSGALPIPLVIEEERIDRAVAGRRLDPRRHPRVAARRRRSCSCSWPIYYS